MSATQSEIVAMTREVVEHLSKNGFMFTALDVSNEVKQELVGVRHRQVSPLVRQLFADKVMGPDYTRTQIDVVTSQGKTVQAFLYHDKNDEHEDYSGSQREQRALPPRATADDDSDL